MTRLLQDVLRERADLAPVPHVDLDRVVAAGERRVRRTRLTTGLAAAAVAAVVAGSAFVLPGLVSPDERGLATEAPSPFTERKVGYAIEDVVQWGSESFSVGAVVTSYVQTDDGFVFTTRNGDVRLYDGHASVLIGHVANHRLRSDDTGSLVAWVDLAEDGHPQYVVFDTHALREVARVDDAAAGPSRDSTEGGAEVFAVDDGMAYWRTSEGFVRYEVTSGRQTVLAGSPVPTDPAHKQPVAYSIEDVAAGRIAYVVDAGQGPEMKVAKSLDLGAPTAALSSNGLLSPAGDFLGAEVEDNIAVYDTTTGADVTPALPGYPFAVVMGWVDEDTAAVFAIKRLGDDTAYPFDMLSCDVPSGDCTVVSRGTAPADAESLVIPVGDPMT